MCPERLPYPWLPLVVALLAIVSAPASAQNDSLRSERGVRLGSYIDIGWTRSTGLLTIPGLEDCTKFTDGDGGRQEMGVLFETPLWRPFGLQLRLGVSRESGSFSYEFDAGPTRDGETGAEVRAIFRDQLDYSRTAVAFSPSVVVPVVAGLRLRLGLEFDHPFLADESYRQIAVTPADLLFGGGKRELEVMHGTIVEQSALGVGLVGGVSVIDVPVWGAALLSPELVFSIPVTDRASSGDWRSYSLSVGATLRFPFGASERVDTVDTVNAVATPPVVVERPLLAPSITTSPDTVRVTIEERDSIEYLPLLNQIYFAEGDSELRPGYRQLSREDQEFFSYAQLTGSALDVYYQILNIIGLRMREKPEATLAINGYRNSRERDPSLARNRAESVREYLVNVWGIAPRRLKAHGGGLPPNPSRETLPEGYEENSRVDLVPSDLDITGPVVRRHTQRDANPPAITFFPDAVSEAGVSDWRLAIQEGGRPWKSFLGNAPVPDSIVWAWRSDSGSLPTLPMRLSYRFAVVDSTGQSAVTPSREIEVRYSSLRAKRLAHQNDTLVENYSLLLFTYDSRKVSETDDLFLQAIAANTGPGAVVTFTGYTDSIGEESYNRDLANARASEAAKIFKRYAPENVTVIVSDKGGERERFPYDTPEGRAHCRTVFIEVRTASTDDGP